MHSRKKLLTSFSPCCIIPQAVESNPLVQYNKGEHGKEYLHARTITFHTPLPSQLIPYILRYSQNDGPKGLQDTTLITRWNTQENIYQ
jgi:hypothetical protein